MDGRSKGTLPPLPGSDERSLGRNSFDGFYRIKARDFWGQNQITRDKVEDFKDCSHYFVKADKGAECEKCHFGLMGSFEISKGKILIKGKPVRFPTSGT